MSPPAAERPAVRSSLNVESRRAWKVSFYTEFTETDEITEALAPTSGGDARCIDPLSVIRSPCFMASHLRDLVCLGELRENSTGSAARAAGWVRLLLCGRPSVLR
jgi:hypothetical protein